MLIRNREELSNQINNFAVETFPGESKPGRKLVNTIVYHKLKDKFYKIEWGEITDDNGVSFLWHNEIAEEVTFNPKGNIGWFTKEEAKVLDYKKGDNIISMNMNSILENVENNIVNIKNFKLGQLGGLDLSEVEIVGARAGQGKTWYAIKETAKHLAKGDSVLFFATNTTESEVMDRLRRVVSETDIVRNFQEDNKTSGERNIASLRFLSKSKLAIDNNVMMDTNYIKRKMSELANSASGLDFVVVDSLQMSLNKDLRNTVEVEEILNELEETALQLGCKILITKQLNIEESLNK